jgi:hypothetical protein
VSPTSRCPRRSSRRRSNRGDRIRVSRNVVPGQPAPVLDDREIQPLAFVDFERGQPLYALVVGFALLVVALAGWQGACSLIGLGVSLVIVVGWMVPSILSGHSPLGAALVGGLAVMLAYAGASLPVLLPRVMSDSQMRPSYQYFDQSTWRSAESRRAARDRRTRAPRRLRVREVENADARLVGAVHEQVTLARRHDVEVVRRAFLRDGLRPREHPCAEQRATSVL